MFECMFCASRETSVVACPECGQHYCGTCYPAHRKMEKNKPFLKLVHEMFPLQGEPATGKSELTGWVKNIPRYVNPNDTLKEGEGTPSPAAANPFIFKRGTGRPDEPPEGAGAPNRPKKTIEVQAMK